MADRGNLHGGSLIFCLCLFVDTTIIVLGYTKCTKIDQCKCSTDKGTIDLWPLVGDGKTARFPKVQLKGSETEEFSWSPCKSFSISDPCEDVTVCLTSAGSTNYYFNLGTIDGAECVLNNGSKECQLKYSGKMHSISHYFSVSLICDENAAGYGTVAEVSSNNNLYTTSLHSKYACISTGLSVGSILLIVFFPVLLVYIFGGMLINKYHKGAKGKELIPNYSFWSDFPSLVVDDVVFTFNGCKRLCSGKKESYEAI